MATLQKLKIPRWIQVDPDDAKKTRYVDAGTPGAVKVQEETKFWYIVYREPGSRTKKKISTRKTDKRSGQAFLAEWLKARERGEVGLTDPYKVHLDRPVIDHFHEYVSTLTNDRHRHEVNRVCRIVFATTGMKTLRDFTAEKIVTYLEKHPGGRMTRKHHRAYLAAFCHWLYPHRIPTCIIDWVPMQKERTNEKPRRKRRAYKIAELQRLMQTALTYPITSRSSGKGGRPKKDGTPAKSRTTAADLSLTYHAELQRQGRDRQLMYRLLLATAMRRGELSRITVSMFDGKRITVPVRLLKCQPENVDVVAFRIPPTLAADLTDHINGMKGDEKLINVPDACNLIKQHKARLKVAGIEYANEDMGFADIHGFRTTGNVRLKRRDIPLHERQFYMRHRTPDITSALYDPDARRVITTTKEAYQVLSALDKKITAPPADPADPTV